jgi:predicted O-linked N-acetylglucosamine transferase (SPINDLY family)
MSLVSRLLGKKAGGDSSATLASADVAALVHEADDHFRAGRMPEARVTYLRAIEIDPSRAQALYMLGGIALNQGDTEAALDFIHRAIASAPDNADYRFSLGTIFANTGRPEEAISCFEEAIRLKPDAADWHRQLAVALHGVGKHVEGLAASLRVTELNPYDAQAFLDLGLTLQKLGKLKNAESAFERAVSLAPDAAGPLVNLAMVRRDQGRPVEAEVPARRAVEIDPTMSQAWFTLGSVLGPQARHFEAAEYLKKAIELNPADDDPWHILMFGMTYSDNWSASEVYEMHRRWGQRLPAGRPRSIDPSHRRANHRLRIGYLSADFRRHPIAHFIEAPLKHHDRTRFEIFCYHTDGRADETTERLKALADHWHWVAGTSDAEIEQAIVTDGIDILIDLSGHTDGQRLRMLARRVAPVQVTYLGYPNTTGVPAIDYRLTDARADPPGESDTLHTEKLVRMPESFLCFAPPDSMGEIGELPMKRNGFVTFGSFNNFTKLSPTTLGLWSEILEATPNSRLMIKAAGLRDEGLRALLLQMLARAGVERGRIEIVSPTISHREHMDAYAEVDIALDTFPYHGTTTTLDALWMGVPVVTLVGDRHASRVGLSILGCLGLTDVVAYSATEYIDAAVRLAADPARLEGIRHSLRSRLATSPLTDGKGFAQRLEHAYLGMWQNALANPGEPNKP